MIHFSQPFRIRCPQVSRLILAALSLTAAASCSEAAPVREHDSAVASSSENAAAPDSRGPIAAAPAQQNAAQPSVSKVLSKEDTAMANGGTSCLVTFTYAGGKPQQFLWEHEACHKVDAAMIARPRLEALGAWAKLDDYGRKFAGGVSDGKLLYISGEHAASLIPLDETGQPFEVEVAD